MLVTVQPDRQSLSDLALIYHSQAPIEDNNHYFQYCDEIPYTCDQLEGMAAMSSRKLFIIITSSIRFSAYEDSPV